VTAVGFQVQLALQRVEDRFDGLAERPEEPFTRPVRLGLAGAAVTTDRVNPKSRRASFL
jgi:hypothetical protein